MEETVARLIETFDVLLNYVPHPGCSIDDTEALKRILDQKLSTEKSATELLFEEPIKNPVDIPPSEVKLYNEVPDVPALLFKKIENLPEEKETPSVEKVKIENVIPQVPSIKTLEERQIIQMNINDKKIRYMEAQNCILEEYIRQAVKHLNTDDLAPAYQAFLKKYPQSPNLETLNKEALVSFLDTMPCSFNEINFLFTILKENGSRRKM